MAMQSDQEFAPTQIARAVFPTAFRGYDQDAVRRYLSRLASALEHQQEYAGLGELEARTPAHERVEELENEAEDLRREIRDLELELVQKSVVGDDNSQVEARPVESTVPFDEHRAIELLGKETARVLESARSAAADILKRAETQAASLKAQAKSELAEARRRADSLVAEKRAETEALATQLTSEAQTEADRLTAEAEEHRAAVLEESAKILTEAEALAESEQQDAEERAKQIVADAETLRQQVVSELVIERREAQVDMDRMTSARDRLAMSLAVARSELDQVADALVGKPVPSGSTSSPPSGDAKKPTPRPIDDLSHRQEVVGLIDQLEAEKSNAEQSDEPFFVDEVAANGPGTVADSGSDSAGESDSDGAAESDSAGATDSDSDSAGASDGDDAATRAAEGDEAPDPEATDDDDESVDVVEIITLDDTPIEPDGGPGEEHGLAGADGQEQELSLVEGFTTIDLTDAEDEDGGPEEGLERADQPSVSDPAPDPVPSVAGGELHRPEEVITTVASRTAAAGVSRTQGDLLVDRPFTGRLPKEFAAREVTLTRSGPNFRRQLRRALNDDQSDVLDRLRAGRGVIKIGELPEFSDQIDRYLAPLRRGLAEIAQAGATAGGQNDLSHAALDNLVRQLAKYIVDRVRVPTIHIIEADTDGDRERILEPIRALYRDFRNGGLAELSEDALYEAFAIGLYDSIEPSSPVTWRVDPRSDPDPICDINRQRTDVVKGATFPSGHARPLALPGCRCLVTVSNL